MKLKELYEAVFVSDDDRVNIKLIKKYLENQKFLKVSDHVSARTKQADGVYATTTDLRQIEDIVFYVAISVFMHDTHGKVQYDVALEPQREDFGQITDSILGEKYGIKFIMQEYDAPDEALEKVMELVKEVRRICNISESTGRPA